MRRGREIRRVSNSRVALHSLLRRVIVPRTFRSARGKEILFLTSLIIDQKILPLLSVRHYLTFHAEHVICMKQVQFSIVARLWVRFPAEIGIFLFIAHPASYSVSFSGVKVVGT